EHTLGKTLLELTAVLLIVGILAGLGITRYLRVGELTRANEAVSSLEQIYHGEMIYREEENTFWPFAAVENNIATINSKLRLTLQQQAQRNWDYSVTAPTADTFIATATRTSGRNVGETININQGENIDKSGWTP
ncbi:MAG: hypothetical protein JW869_00115, partial [Candidatus Omnitrophica bacterium]|nr:hypothetical protein [Candidatus Omnitrophota bacterium]